MGPAIRLIKLFGIPIEINFSWIFVFLLVIYMLGDQFGDFYPTWSTVHRWALAVGIALLFFLSVLAHELSHSLLAVKKGIPVNRITLFLFGGVSQLSHEARRPMTEFAVTVVGPVSSMLLALVIFGFWWAFRDVSPSLEITLRLLMGVNLMLGVFNLLPGFPLDGGRILRAAAWGISGNYWLATRIAARVGQGIGGLMVIGGGSLAFLDFRQFGVFGIWMSLIGAFLLVAATTSYRQEKAREGLKTYRVADVMTHEWGILPVETSMDSPLVGQGLARHNDLVMVSGDGQMVGLLTRRLMASAPRGPGPTTPLSLIMQPLRNTPWLAPDDTISDAMDRVQNGRQERFPVWRDGELLGLVGREEILRFTRNVLGQGTYQRKS